MNSTLPILLVLATFGPAVAAEPTPSPTPAPSMQPPPPACTAPEHRDEALKIIDRAETRGLFEVPIYAIEVRRDPASKVKLATKRLALVEAFLEKVSHRSTPDT